MNQLITKAIRRPETSHGLLLEDLKIDSTLDHNGRIDGWIIYNGDGLLLADVYLENVAKLFAAAPDLLELLRLVEDHCDMDYAVKERILKTLELFREKPTE